MKMLRLCAALLALGVLSSAYADINFRFREYAEDPDEPKWQEGETTLPNMPKDEDLLEFYVSAQATNRFFVDGKSISSGSDDVVRFTLVVMTSGGARNVTFEGIRCETRETRLYAIESNGRWSKPRSGAWKPIENKPINRHHASLSRDYFCPSGSAIRSPEEGRDALRRGGHPNAV